MVLIIWRVIYIQHSKKNLQLKLFSFMIDLHMADNCQRKKLTHYNALKSDLMQLNYKRLQFPPGNMGHSQHCFKKWLGAQLPQGNQLRRLTKFITSWMFAQCQEIQLWITCQKSWKVLCRLLELWLLNQTVVVIKNENSVLSHTIDSNPKY